ncbi:hypothetical protein [Blastopirellula marina]|uniref:hypothetical protein n=1 Tax=Blastopirellula marina TaxID=124 RepID=UPI001304FF6D|nr:hypothetical protein [Blastopirellula marina]
MSTQQELNRGRPQADPDAAAPPKGVPTLAIILVGLGLIAGLIVAGPAVAWMTGS